MMTHIWGFGWLIIAALAGYAIYRLIVKPRLDEAAIVTGKEHQLDVHSGSAWLWRKLENWKTPILAVVSGVPQLIQMIDVASLTEIQNLPWGTIFDPKVANFISALCAFAIPVTHAMGVLKAAKTIPQVSVSVDAA